MIWNNKNQVTGGSRPRHSTHTKNQKQSIEFPFNQNEMLRKSMQEQTEYEGMEFLFCSKQSCRKMSDIRQRIFDMK